MLITATMGLTDLFHESSLFRVQSPGVRWMQYQCSCSSERRKCSIRYGMVWYVCVLECELACNRHICRMSIPVHIHIAILNSYVLYS